jgi:hypothetical protein
MQKARKIEMYIYLYSNDIDDDDDDDDDDGSIAIYVGTIAWVYIILFCLGRVGYSLICVVSNSILLSSLAY